MATLKKFFWQFKKIDLIKLDALIDRLTSFWSSEQRTLKLVDTQKLQATLESNFLSIWSGIQAI